MFKSNLFTKAIATFKVQPRCDETDERGNLEHHAEITHTFMLTRIRRTNGRETWGMSQGGATHVAYVISDNKKLDPRIREKAIAEVIINNRKCQMVVLQFIDPGVALASKVFGNAIAVEMIDHAIAR